MSAYTRGFAFIEVIFFAAIFLVITAGVYLAYITLNRSSSLTEQKLFALEIINDKFERARLLPYGSLVSSSETIEKNGFAFTVLTTVASSSVPFSSKLVEVNVDCAACKNFTDILVAARISP